MDKMALRRIGWIGASLGLTSALVGCGDLQSDTQSASAGDGTITGGYLDSMNGLNSVNGLSAANGLSSANGLGSANGLNSVNGLSAANGNSSENGLNSVNGLNVVNGLNTANGLSSANGLMTTSDGRMTVSYLTRCALPAGDTLVKQDQNGTNYTFNGGIGLAPQYKTGGCDLACTEALSACMMAHINTSGVHIPLWMTSPMSAIGWGQSPYFPTQEGTFFGQIMLTNEANNLDGYYCNGPSVGSDVVPGRLGSNQGQTPYANAYPTDGGQCNKAGHCTMQANGDGAVTCKARGVDFNSPITVWRGQIKQAEAFAPAGMIVSDSANSGGKRVGNFGPTAGITITGVYSGAAGTNQLVLYYANGDCPTGLNRYFNVKVNGGPAQNRALGSMECGNWHKIGQVMVTLTGFNAGSNNKVEFFADGQHAAPDLDWIEVVNTTSTSGATTTTNSSGGTTAATTTSACVPGKTVAMKSGAAGKYVSARQEDNGNLNPTIASVGTWEKFQIVDAGGGFVALKSLMNGMYVTVEGGTANQPLRARSTAIGSWEKFTFETLPTSGHVALKASVNGKYVQANMNLGNDTLQANAGAVGGWEDFTCEQQ